MEFGYWPFKGRAEPIRLLLALLKIEYKEVNPKSRKLFKQSAKDLGLPFHNLPYLIDGKTKIAESTAIPLYVAWKAGRIDLFGGENLERVQHQMVCGVLLDVQQVVIEVIFRPDYEVVWELKEKFLYEKIEELSTFLAEKPFFLGQLTYSDLIFFVSYEAAELIATSFGKPSFFEKYQNLKLLYNRVAALEGIREYLKNDPRAKRIFLPSSHVKPKL